MKRRGNLKQQRRAAVEVTANDKKAVPVQGKGDHEVVEGLSNLIKTYESTTKSAQEAIASRRRFTTGRR